MAMTIKEIEDWFRSLESDEEVFIDDDGLRLRIVSDPDVYLEIGGKPE